MLQINRLGGADLPDTVGHAGAFLTHVPSGSELLTGIQYFFILSESAFIEIISSTPDVVVDNIMLSPLSTLPNPFGKWYFFKHSINGSSQEIHFIYSIGNFAATTTGYHPIGGMTSYGYEIAYNKPQYGGKYSTKSTMFSPITPPSK
uniref:IgGFc-binding protein N-terminal domain-containing protein n=1 Tax=Panagrolaimus sp. ES5 TaxID=591445 RepID=A0AC34F8J5_9BILA